MSEELGEGLADEPEEKLSGFANPSCVSQTFLAALRFLSKLRFLQSPDQSSTNVATVASNGGHFLSMWWNWPLHLKAYSHRLSFHCVDHLVPEPRANYHWHTSRQGLHEAVLAAVGQEQVHACFQQWNLRKNRQAECVSGDVYVRERIRLPTDGDYEQRGLRGLIRSSTEGIEDGTPSCLTQLLAS